MWLWLVFITQTWFMRTIVWVLTGLWNKISLPHQYQEYSKDYEIQESLEICGLFLNDQIVEIAAENSSIDTAWLKILLSTLLGWSVKQHYRQATTVTMTLNHNRIIYPTI